MDNSQYPLSIESFSYSWLVNLRPSLDTSFRDSFDESHSFIEMDPKMPPSKRFFRTSHEFKFDFPTISQSTITSIVHADELFSNGYVLPLNNAEEASSYYEEASSSLSTPARAGPVRSGPAPLRRCRTVSGRVFRKYLFFLKPLYRRMCGRSGDGGFGSSRARVARKWVPESSPRISVAYSADDGWRRSCDSESSIHDAVLHCKRSIGN